MGTYRIAVVVGSIRKDSFNRKLATALARLAPADCAFQQVRIDDLPLYNQDDDGATAEAVRRFKAEIAGAQGVLFVTPEYNRSIPGVLKNAIDIGTRPGGSNSLAGKRAAILGTSPGAHGTVSAQQHLRTVLSAVDLAVLPQPEIAIQYREGQIDADGNVSDERLRKRLQLFLDRFEAWLAA